MLYSIKFRPDDAFRLIWGRFVNTTGYVGKNVSLHLHMEHLNNYLKELVRALRGKISKENCQRMAKSLNKTMQVINAVERS